MKQYSKYLLASLVFTAFNACSYTLNAQINQEKYLSVNNAEMIIGSEKYLDSTSYFSKDGTPKYFKFYSDHYKYIADTFFTSTSDDEIKKMRDSQFGDVVSALLWLEKSGGGKQYLQRAHDLFGILLGYADGNKLIINDPFGFYPVLKSAILLKEANKFDPEWEPVLRRFTEEGVTLLNLRFPTSDGNQDLARMYSCLLAKKLYPDMRVANEAALKVKSAYEKFIKKGDIYIDSRNYFEVSLTFFILIAHELDQEKAMASSPTFKRMFENFRDVISPNGFMPEFGHGYFSPNHYDRTPVFLEYAAALYNDLSFSFAARKYYSMLVKFGPLKATGIKDAAHQCVHVMPQLLDIFQVKNGNVSPPAFISGVDKRIAEFGEEKWSFLILRPSLESGAPMIMMDLLCLGDHAQTEFGASVCYYESAHVPLFYQYGRYINGASRGNQLIFGQSGAKKPDPEWEKETWRTVSIPTNRIAEPDGKARIEAISFRTDSRKKTTESGLIIDNIRLSGPAGTKTVCDFSTLNFNGNSNSLVDGKNTNQKSLLIFNNGNGLTAKNFNPFAFNSTDYVELLFDVKWFGKERPTAQFRPTSQPRSWTSVNQSTLLANLIDVKTERNGKDCWARLEYSAYGTFDSRLVRQIVLTREGVLAIRDDIKPGVSADGLPAFSLWQMYSVDNERNGRFSTTGECSYPSCDLSDLNQYKRGMSVYFSGYSGITFGQQIIPNGKLGNYAEIQRDRDLRTVFSRLIMKTGTEVYMNLLVIPHSPNENLSTLDKNTTTKHSSSTSIYNTNCDGNYIKINISKNGNWIVVRNPSK